MCLCLNIYVVSYSRVRIQGILWDSVFQDFLKISLSRNHFRTKIPFPKYNCMPKPAKFHFPWLKIHFPRVTGNRNPRTLLGTICCPESQSQTFVTLFSRTTHHSNSTFGMQPQLLVPYRVMRFETSVTPTSYFPTQSFFEHLHGLK